MISARNCAPGAYNGVSNGVGTEWSTGWVWVISGSVAMVLYGLTMAPDLLWGDSGEAQLRVLSSSLRGGRSLARAHCTYYAVAIAISRVFDVEAARAANLTAAIAGAITIANVSALVTHMATRRSTVVASVCMLMVSHTLWQMSTGAEVVTFYTMVMTAEVYAIWMWARSSHNGWLMGAMFLNGVAFATHNVALLFMPAYCLIIVMAVREGKASFRKLAIALLLWCIGAIPVWVLIAQEVQRGMSAGGVVESLLFGRFGNQVLNASLSLQMLLRVIAMAIYNFPSPLIILCIAGWWWSKRGVPTSFWFFVTFAFVCVTGFAIRYNVADQYTFMVPSYVLMTMSGAVGIDQWLHKGRSRVTAGVVMGFAVMAPVVYAATPTLVRRFAPSVIPKSAGRIPYREPYDWLLQPWRCGYDGARQYAESVYEVLPDDAFLLVLDTMRPPLDYLQGRDGRRLDVCLSYSPFEWVQAKECTHSRENTDAMVREGRLFASSRLEGYVSPWLLDGRFEFVPIGPVFKIVNQGDDHRETRESP